MDKDFFAEVYKLVRQIPLGRVSSYGAIARVLGSPQAARMVGWAMNKAHQQTEYVPAHRVVNRQGLLTGKHHFAGPRMMQDLLEGEGIKVENDRILNFEQVFWSPEELIEK